ncbi:hypothetical protein E3N88_31573 [Mikania micrantha]|uniref:Uncharacterized protein n=1 Tax=Mikania micrantha TaxID=192012 RepID=A0A5N6MQQ0_9ASTR|nr:hypothetical protein E3N88_31573 [Mikania micrantha]
MMNVGENRAPNGVLDCPKSKNEEKFLSVGRMGSSRYAEVGLRVLRGTRCMENIEDSPEKLRGLRTQGTHQGSFLQDLIVVLKSEIRQIR